MERNVAEEVFFSCLFFLFCLFLQKLFTFPYIHMLCSEHGWGSLFPFSFLSLVIVSMHPCLGLFVVLGEFLLVSLFLFFESVYRYSPLIDCYTCL